MILRRDAYLPEVGEATRLQRVYGASAGQALGGRTTASMPSVTAGMATGLLSIRRSRLRVAAFRLHRWGQVFINPVVLDIDLAPLASELVRVIAIHNFRLEDGNPHLHECLAGVFLAKQAGGRWEEAEDYPVECRSLAVLGHVDSAARVILPP